MLCPSCNSTQIFVRCTRQDTDASILRYRFCKSCKHKFFTLESQVDAKFIWHSTINSRVPKSIQREAILPAEKEAGLSSVICKP